LKAHKFHRERVYDQGDRRNVGKRTIVGRRTTFYIVMCDTLATSEGRGGVNSAWLGEGVEFFREGEYSPYGVAR